jgi:hypothetical protein
MPAKRVQNMRPDSPGRQGDTKNPRTFDVRGRMQQRFVRGDYLERQAHTRTPGSASTPGATGRGRISWLYRPYTLPERSTGTIRSCEDEQFSDGAPKITLHLCADFCRRARTPMAHRRQERIVVDSGVMSRGKMTLLTYETDDIAT